jgi:hypothetical protein
MLVPLMNTNELSHWQGWSDAENDVFDIITTKHHWGNYFTVHFFPIC